MRKEQKKKHKNELLEQADQHWSEKTEHFFITADTVLILNYFFPRTLRLIFLLCSSVYNYIAKYCFNDQW